MKVLIAVSAVLVIDAAATVAVVMMARKNPSLRRRLIDGFRVLVGDAWLRVEPAHNDCARCKARDLDAEDEEDFPEDDSENSEESAPENRH